MKPIRARNFVQTTPIGSRPKPEKPQPEPDNAFREIVERLVVFSMAGDVGPSQQLRNIVESAKKALFSSRLEVVPVPVKRPPPPLRSHSLKKAKKR